MLHHGTRLDIVGLRTPIWLWGAIDTYIFQTNMSSFLLHITAFCFLCQQNRIKEWKGHGLSIGLYQDSGSNAHLLVLVSYPSESQHLYKRRPRRPMFPYNFARSLVGDRHLRHCQCKYLLYSYHVSDPCSILWRLKP